MTKVVVQTQQQVAVAKEAVLHWDEDGQHVR